MKTLAKRIAVFVILFIIALIAYFIWTPDRNKPEGVVYTDIQDPAFPVVWLNVLGRNMNVMHPYTSAVGINAFYDTLTLLPEDRKLNIFVEASKEKLNSVSYEIRSENLSELIEKTEVTEYTLSEDGSASIVLPIQNLLLEGREYRLDITLDFAGKKDVHYYSRIMIGNQELAAAMLDLAVGFSEKNFNYETARENTMYLETNSTGDNTTLAHVNLKSKFDMLTYNQLKLEQQGDKDIRLCAFDGSMGEIKISSLARRVEDDRTEEYEITESFTLRQGPERLYMMDYEREMIQIFPGDTSPIHGGRITFGITDADHISTMNSSKHEHMAFVSNRDLYLYDSTENSLKSIFSFRKSSMAAMQSGYAKHDLRIVSVEEDGSTVFLVYGYMNSGAHEGNLGVSVYRYDRKEDAILEKCFIPVDSSYEEIAEGIRELAYLGANSMLYIRLADSVYGIDIHSSDYVMIADALKAGTYSVNAASDGLAWQSIQDRDGAKSISFMDLSSGIKKEITAENGLLLRPIGFVDRDLIVAEIQEKEQWNINGKSMPKPISRVRILNFNLDVVKEYEKEGRYLSDFFIEEGRIHLDVLEKISDDGFSKVETDTIVSTVEPEAGRNKEIGYYASEEKGRIYYAALSKAQAFGEIRLENANKISYETASKINIGSAESERYYTAVGHGKMIGIYEHAADAIKAAYEQMGSVRKAGKLIYMRADTAAARNLKQPSDLAQEILQAREEDKLFDLRGVSLKQSLYYVSNGYPVLAYSDGGAPLLIYSYTRNDISVYEISSGNTIKLDMAAAEAMFGISYNDFSCSFTFD